MSDVYINRCYSHNINFNIDYIEKIKTYEKYYLIVNRTPVSPIGYLLNIYDNKHVKIKTYEIDVYHFEFKICEDYFIHWTYNRMWISHIRTDASYVVIHTEPILDVCCINGNILFNSRVNKPTNLKAFNTSVYSTKMEYKTEFELYKFHLDTNRIELLFFDYSSNVCVFDNIHETYITKMSNITTQNIEKLNDKLVILSWLGPSAVVFIWNLDGPMRKDKIPRLTVYRYELLISNNRLYISVLNTDTLKIYTQHGKSILFNVNKSGPHIYSIIGLFQNNYIVSRKYTLTQHTHINITDYTTNNKCIATRSILYNDIYCIFDKLIIKTPENKYIVYSLMKKKKLLIIFSTLFPGLSIQLIYNCMAFGSLKS